MDVKESFNTDRIAATVKIPNQIKMVIWDLDETFWFGTLSEGGIQVCPSNVEMVRVLNSRGIVSSICSKNDHDHARQELERIGIWNDFVFPRIAFAAKGPAIASIVDDANLRPDNVLFIDDNHLNLEEARHCCP